MDNDLDDVGTTEPEAQSLDVLLNTTFDDIEQRDPEEKPQRARDEVGRFANKVAAPAEATPAKKDAIDPIAPDASVSAPAPAQAPNTWTPAARAKFAGLEPDVQSEIVKREQDMARAITMHDQERTFGKSVKDVVGPYLPMIQAEGATPETAIQSLLNTAYRLRTSSPQEKGVLLANLARQYGADMSAFNGDQEQVQIDPTVQALQQKLQQLEGFINQQHTQQQTQSEHNLLRDINAFQADPAHPHFERVGQEMAGLIKAGLAANLQEAYDKAIYMQPDVRQQVISAQQTDIQRKQIEEAKRRADAAKKSASINLTSRPSLPSRAQLGSIDQTLAETYDRMYGST